MTGVHPIQVRRAFIEDRGNMLVALVDRLDGDELHVTGLDGSQGVVRVADPAAVSEVIAEPSATLLRGRRLALVNERYRLLGLAFGPPAAPSRLAVVAVVNLDDSSIPPSEDQPGWRLVALADPPPAPA